MNLPLSNKALSMKPSQTLLMSEMARDLIDSGTNVAVMSAGEPDATSHEEIGKVLCKSLTEGKTHYAPVKGNANIIKAIRHKFLRDQRLSYEPYEVMATAGAKSAIKMAVDCIANAGDEVIVCAPYWVSYIAHIKLCGAIPKIINTRVENNFMPSGQDIEQAISPKTKAIILNSPNNPSGAVISEDNLADIASVLKDKNIWVISDEIYEKLLFDDAKHFSIASNKAMFDKTIVINGLSKAYAMTGFRVGIVGAPKQIITAMGKLQGQEITCLPEFVQDAAAYALMEPEPIKQFLRDTMSSYIKRREIALNLASQIPSIKAYVPKGAFYLWIDVKEAMAKKNAKDDLDFSIKMLNEAHVACVSGSSFGMPGFLRVSIASSQDVIEQGFHRLKNWLM